MDTTDITASVRQIKTLAEALLLRLASLLPKISSKDRDLLVKQGKCLHCKRPIEGKSVRGLHEYCRQELKKLYSDDELVAAGYLLPAKKGGRPKGAVGSALQDADAAIARVRSDSARPKHD